MATLKNTVINDTGHLTLPVGTTAQRPASPVTGMTRFNTTENGTEVYTGTAWNLDISPDGTSATKAAVNATQLLSYQSTSGYYWIKPPNAPSAYYVYCDQVNYSRGWMLLMNVATSTTTHYSNNSAVTTTLNGNTTVEFNNNTIPYKWSTVDINYFLQQPGNKVMWVEKKRSTPETPNGNGNSGNGWFIPIGTQSSPVWPTNLQCTEYNTLISSATTSWLWTGCATHTDARDNINVATGSYSSANHQAPTIYPHSQSFFGNDNAIRFATGWNSQAFTVNSSGSLWIKIF